MMMKFRTVGLLVVAVAATAFAVQDQFQLLRKYKEGERDSYKMAVTATMALGAVDMTMNMHQTVKKVYENGDADIETQMADMRMSFGGQEMPAPTENMPAIVQKLDKMGRPVGQPQGQANPMMSQMSFMRYAGFTGDKALTVGTTIKVDEKDEKEGSHTTGTILLEKIEGGNAFITADLQVKNKQTGDSPMKVVMKSQIVTETGKIHKVDGTITNLPDSGQGMTVDEVKLTMERVVK